MERSKAPATAAPREPQAAAASQAASLADSSPRQLAQRRQIQSLFGPAGRGGPVLQGAFIVNGNAITGANLDTWIETWVAEDKPEVAAMVREWAGDVGHTKDHATDLEAYNEAVSKATDKRNAQNSTVAHAIGQQNPPNVVAWGTVPIWAAWYFAGLEYQNNSTNGWHANRSAWLPSGVATPDGQPTRYVEFRRPGAIGEKEADKLERCIFDLLTGRCFPNAHYDGGYVEIGGVPAAISRSLYMTAYAATGLKDRAARMTAQEIATAGQGPARTQWLLAHVNDPT